MRTRDVQPVHGVSLDPFKTKSHARIRALGKQTPRGFVTPSRGCVRRQSIRTGTTIPDEDELKRRNVRRGRSHLRLCLLALRAARFDVLTFFRDAHVVNPDFFINSIFTSNNS